MPQPSGGQFRLTPSPSLVRRQSVGPVQVPRYFRVPRIACLPPVQTHQWQQSEDDLAGQGVWPPVQNVPHISASAHSDRLSRQVHGSIGIEESLRMFLALTGTAASSFESSDRWVLKSLLVVSFHVRSVCRIVSSSYVLAHRLRATGVARSRNR